MVSARTSATTPASRGSTQLPASGPSPSACRSPIAIRYNSQVHMVQPEPPCVYCRRQPADPAWRPFCSERCKLADLGRWLSEDYRDPRERRCRRRTTRRRRTE